MDIKYILVEAIKKRDMITALLGSLDAGDVENGKLVLKASFLSEDLKPFVLANAGAFLKSYQVDFVGGQIRLQASLDIKQLGPIDVSYKVTITELRFDQTSHKLYATFVEDANARGNMVQKLALKAASLNGPLLKTAVNLSKANYVHVDGNNLLVDFDQLEAIHKLPDDLALRFISAKDSKLTLAFQL